MDRLKYLDITEFGVWWETGIVPDATTEVRMELAPYNLGISWRGWLGSQSSDDSADTYQLRIDNNTDKFNARVGKGSLSPVVAYTPNTWYNLVLNATGLTIDGDLHAFSSTGFTTEPTRELYINGINNSGFASSTYRSGKGKFGEVVIVKNNVVVLDYIPVIDENNVACFYDKVSQAYKYNSGSNHPTAGPLMFGPEVSELVMGAAGGSETIGMYADRNWSVSTSAEWITLSTTGGTSADTAVTITCGTNYGTDREGTVVFTDGTNTATLTVSQDEVDPMPFHKIIRGTLKIN